MPTESWYEAGIIAYRAELRSEDAQWSYDRFSQYLAGQKRQSLSTRYQYLREYRLYLQAVGAGLSQRQIDEFLSTDYLNEKEFKIRITGTRRAMLRLLQSWHTHMLRHPAKDSPYHGIPYNERLEKMSRLQLLTIPDAKKPKTRPKRFLSEAQMNAWVERLRGRTDLPSWYLPLVLLLSDSGMRLGEALSVKRSHLKKGRETITVDTKGNNAQRKGVRSQTVDALLEYAATEKKRMTDYLFADENGEPLLQPNVRYYFAKYAVGEDVHPHMLRRYVASKLHRMHFETLIIKEILGHQSVQTTQRYIEVDPEAVEAARKTYHEDIKW